MILWFFFSSDFFSFSYSSLVCIKKLLRRKEVLEYHSSVWTLKTWFFDSPKTETRKKTRKRRKLWKKQVIDLLKFYDWLLNIAPSSKEVKKGRKKNRNWNCVKCFTSILIWLNLNTTNFYFMSSIFFVDKWVNAFDKNLV